MKHIYLNLKRFDAGTEFGGVNRLAPLNRWARTIVQSVEAALEEYDPREVEFVQFYPELHLLQATGARQDNSNLRIGSQGVFREDVEQGKNFGAFTTTLPAAVVADIGCSHVLIGHCEERKNLRQILQAGGSKDESAISGILNKEILAAQNRGLSVVYCIGEDSHEQARWQEVLRDQVQIGLQGVDRSRVVIAYEPIWSIGPGKEPADKAYITKIAQFIKKEFGDIDVVYGGGLKAENAAMLASIDEISGGLIALTRFQGEIGFYPEEYLEIIRLYLGK